jgi:preprotein translocase subunit YajC
MVAGTRLTISAPLLLAQAEGGSALAALFPILLIMVVFYFLLILPAQRRQKRHQQMLASLKAGDQVITSGGLYGTIVGLDEQSVQLRIADQVRVRVARSAIAALQPPSSKEN